MKRLILLLAVSCLAQSAPPIDADVFTTPNKLLTKYDEFTDKTRVSVMIPISSDGKTGLALIASGYYEGKKPKADAEGSLMFIIVGDQASHKDDLIYFLIDGERVEVKPLYSSHQNHNLNKTMELMALPPSFSAKEFQKLSAAKSFRGRIGSDLTFELDAAAKQRLGEIAKALQAEKQKEARTQQ